VSTDRLTLKRIRRPKMGDWISDLLLFSAGITGGILVTMIKPILSAAKRRRTELVAARSRILAGMKEQHDKEILDEAFRATEEIRGELDKTRETLRKTLITVLEPGDDQRNGEHKPVIHLTRPAKPKRSVS
jgi:hypothetical protein